MNHFKKFLIVCSLSIFVLSLFPLAEGLGAEQLKCPVLGYKPSKKTFVDYKGKRIYFCCPPCIEDFNKNPEKYMKQFEKEGMVLEDAPVPKK